MSEDLPRRSAAQRRRLLATGYALGITGAVLFGLTLFAYRQIANSGTGPAAIKRIAGEAAEAANIDRELGRDLGHLIGHAETVLGGGHPFSAPPPVERKPVEAPDGTMIAPDDPRYEGVAAQVAAEQADEEEDDGSALVAGMEGDLSELTPEGALARVTLSMAGRLQSYSGWLIDLADKEAEELREKREEAAEKERKAAERRREMARQDTAAEEEADDKEASGGGDPGLVWEHGRVLGVDNDGWTRVSLAERYTTPVVVCTPRYTESEPPAVVRVRNADSEGFDLRLQRMDGKDGDTAGITIDYLVVEEGVYDIERHGVIMEARRHVSQVTAHDEAWVAEAVEYGNEYASPVILGQVMTANDSAPSTFWCHGGGIDEPPSPDFLHVGKHVAGAENLAQADETLGYVVLESGPGTLPGGIEFRAGLGEDQIQGLGDDPPYSYRFPALRDATHALATIAGMEGGDGGWAVLYGTPAVRDTGIDLAIDEDQVADSERSHTDERVGYLVLAASETDPAESASKTSGDNTTASDESTDADAAENGSESEEQDGAAAGKGDETKDNKEAGEEGKGDAEPEEERPVNAHTLHQLSPERRIEVYRERSQRIASIADRLDRAAQPLADPVSWNREVAIYAALFALLAAALPIGGGAVFYHYARIRRRSWFTAITPSARGRLWRQERDLQFNNYTSYLTHVLLIVLPFLGFHCAYNLGPPGGGGGEVGEENPEQQVKVVEVKRRKLIVNPFSPISLEKPEEVEIEIEEITKRMATAAKAGGEGEGEGGYEGGEGTAFVFVAINHGGAHWDEATKSGAAKDFLRYFGSRTGVKTNREPMELRIGNLIAQDDDNQQPAMIYMSFSGSAPRFSSKEIKFLRRYVEDIGGVILIDAVGGGAQRHAKSLGQKVTNGSRWRAIGRDDELMRSREDLRQYTDKELALAGHDGNKLLGIRASDGYWCVIYHPGDLVDAWRGAYDAEWQDTGFKIGTNVADYAMKRFTRRRREP